ncbi:GGDEF domain-containing protein [Pseudobacteroides cellulosolvens]|uniref:Diguanylate cyclase n=1 Tax=Pseudobacteroides cellulosolvens ATCC 35603 = DSM 2933 TaxID=398512 RepID=A0A0L6JSU2_9FIRM|nr:GGDEF domain-containing protein [Pseudobacteroides cellulosolvens]KNY28916.1 diguanylate cyclase [Pseudobacteroides cellulosolvens ATCC 35603 = DSM 2933]
MYQNGRKTIGLFVSGFHNEYPSLFIPSVSREAEKLGYNVAVFNFVGRISLSEAYGEGEIGLLDTIPFERLDGIIILDDIFVIPSFLDEIYNRIDNRTSCPVVHKAAKKEGGYQLQLDHGKGIEMVMKHFVLEHGFTRIYYMSGPYNHTDAIARLASYKKFMEKYQLPYDDKYVFEGDFWTTYCNEAADYFLTLEEELPQAIVCANDYMAIGLCDALIKRGINIPGDIAISGFDNIWKTSVHIPSITTVGFPIVDIAVQSVHIIDNVLNGYPQEKIIKVEPALYCNNSCGCEPEDLHEALKKRSTLLQEYSYLMDTTFVDMFVIILEHMKADTIMDIRKIFYNSVHDFKDSHRVSLCLYQNDKGVRSYEEPIEKVTDTIYVAASIDRTNPREPIHKEDFCIPAKDILDISSFKDEPIICQFIDIHFEKHLFGYLTISYKNYATSTSFAALFAVNLATSMEAMLNKNKINSLISNLEELNIRDQLTGVYNRRGYELLSEDIYQNAVQNQKEMLFMVMDMDGLKYINDHYGHSVGDQAIVLLANALKKASHQNELIARVGGDEFYIMGNDYSQDKFDDFVMRFTTILDLLCRDNRLEFCITASYGYQVLQPETGIQVKDYIQISDRLMYQKKNERKNKNLYSYR